MRVYLFGSFAAGRPTPRSDADIALIVEDSADENLPAYAKDVATTIFLDAPIPVELFVLTRERFEEGRKTGRGLAGAIAREGILLA